VSSISEVSGLLGVGVGICGALFALAANRTSRWVASNDARIRLFEERMKVFRAFKKLIMDFSSTLKVDGVVLSNAVSAFETAHFIFIGPEIPSYLDKVVEKILKHAYLEKKGNQTSDDIAELMEIQLWLIKQNKDSLPLFQKHMSLLKTYNAKVQP
jgi:hypothetical protein